MKKVKITRGAFRNNNNPTLFMCIKNTLDDDIYIKVQNLYFKSNPVEL